MTWVLVAALGAAGAVLRVMVDRFVTLRVPSQLPLGTAVVNVSGTFALGVLAGAAAGAGVSPLVGTALLGSYTTFSSWMWETVTLAGAGGRTSAVWNVALQLVLGLLTAWAGWAVGGALAWG